MKTQSICIKPLFCVVWGYLDPIIYKQVKYIWISVNCISKKKRNENHFSILLKHSWFTNHTLVILLYKQQKQQLISLIYWKNKRDWLKHISMLKLQLKHTRMFIHLITQILSKFFGSYCRFLMHWRRNQQSSRLTTCLKLWLRGMHWILLMIRQLRTWKSMWLQQ